MMDEREQVYEVSSFGRLYRRSVEWLAHHLEDAAGRELHLDDLGLHDCFFVVYRNGTGFTRTSAVRVV